MIYSYGLVSFLRILQIIIYDTYFFPSTVLMQLLYLYVCLMGIKNKLGMWHAEKHISKEKFIFVSPLGWGEWQFFAIFCFCFYLTMFVVLESR